MVSAWGVSCVCVCVVCVCVCVCVCACIVQILRAQLMMRAGTWDGKCMGIFVCVCVCVHFSDSAHVADDESRHLGW